MAGYLLAVLTGNGYESARLIRYTVPLDTVALLRVGRIFLYAKALAVEQQFHLVTVSVGIERNLTAVLAVPVLRNLANRDVHVVPHRGALCILYHADVYRGCFGEEALHEVRVRLRLQRDVEHALVPTLGRPSETFAEVVDGSPVSQSDGLVEVHLEEVRSHGSRGSLALVEHLVREAFAVAGEVHVAVVVRVHLRLDGEVARQGVRLPVAVAWVHGHGGQSRVVVAVQQFLLQLVSRYAPVVVWHGGNLLQLVSEAPEHDAGVVAVALHPFGDVLLPQLSPFHASAGVLLRPFVVQFVDDEDAEAVAYLHEVLAVGVVRAADVVHAELLHHLQSLLYGTRVSRCAQCAKSVVVGIALEQHLLAVQLQTAFWCELYGAHAKLLLHLVCHVARLVVDGHFGGVEVWVLARPEVGVWNVYGRQFVLACAPLCVNLQIVLLLSHDVACCIVYLHLARYSGVSPLLSGVPLLVADFDVQFQCLVVLRADVQRVSCHVDVLVSDDDVNVSVQTGTRVPA